MPVNVSYSNALTEFAGIIIALLSFFLFLDFFGLDITPRLPPVITTCHNLLLSEPFIAAQLLQEKKVRINIQNPPCEMPLATVVVPIGRTRRKYKSYTSKNIGPALKTSCDRSKKV